jgi:hypothetical protein
MIAEARGAGAVLAAAARAALEELGGLNHAYDGPPLQAAFPYAIVDAGAESDWSHKTGEGRELRLAVTIRDQSERPARLRALMEAAEAAIGGLDGDLGGWRLVTMKFLRSRMLREKGAAWTGAIDYRARMLRE